MRRSQDFSFLAYSQNFSASLPYSVYDINKPVENPTQLRPKI
jgi:hypothetical protein